MIEQRGTTDITTNIGRLITPYKNVPQIGPSIDIKLSKEEDIHITSHCERSSADFEKSACRVVIESAIPQTVKKYAAVYI